MTQSTWSGIKFCAFREIATLVLAPSPKQLATPSLPKAIQLVDRSQYGEPRPSILFTAKSDGLQQHHPAPCGC